MRVSQQEARPLIGICGDVKSGTPPVSRLRLDYVQAVEEAGGLPVILPPVVGAGARERILERIDGLLFPGGDDYSPLAYGKEELHPRMELLHPMREAFDLAMARLALGEGSAASDLAVLGICGGCQLINIVLGGDLIPDIPELVPGALRHRAAQGEPPARHEISIEPDSLIERIAGGLREEVGSAHHQSVGRLGKGLRIAARAADGVVEAVEGADTQHHPGRKRAAGRFLLGVQWHPEREPARPINRAVLRALIDAARPRANGRSG